MVTVLQQNQQNDEPTIDLLKQILDKILDGKNVPDKMRESNQNLLDYLNAEDSRNDRRKLQKVDNAYATALFTPKFSDDERNTHKEIVLKKLINKLVESVGENDEAIAPAERMRDISRMIEVETSAIPQASAEEKIAVLQRALKEDPAPAGAAFLKKLAEVKEEAAKKDDAQALAGFNSSDEARNYQKELKSKKEGFFSPQFTPDKASEIVSMYINGRGKSKEALAADAKYLRGELDIIALSKEENRAAVAYIDAQMKHGVGGKKVTAEEAFANLQNLTNRAAMEAYQPHEGKMRQYRDVRLHHDPRYINAKPISLDAALDAMRNMTKALIAETNNVQAGKGTMQLKPEEEQKKPESNHGGAVAILDGGFSTFGGDNTSPSGGPKTPTRKPGLAA